MVDKKILTMIGALLVIAVIVIAIVAMRPSFGGGEDSFSDLFDKLDEGNWTVHESYMPLVLSSEFEDGQEIIVEDRIIAMEGEDATRFYFLYTGDKWVDEEEGTDFAVPTDATPYHQYDFGYIGVSDGVFSIQFNEKYTASFDVGDSIRMTTKVVSEEGVLVFDHDWEILIS